MNLSQFCNDREVGIDDICDFVFDGLAHQHRGGPLVESVVRKTSPARTDAFPP
jgi:hypothetical protein